MGLINAGHPAVSGVSGGGFLRQWLCAFKPFSFKIKAKSKRFLDKTLTFNSHKYFY